MIFVLTLVKPSLRGVTVELDLEELVEFCKRATGIIYNKNKGRKALKMGDE